MGVVHRASLNGPALRAGEPLALFALGFLVAVAFLPWTIAPATTPRWAVMAAFVPGILFFSDARTPRLLLLSLMLVLGASVFWSPDRLTGVDDFSRFAIAGAVFALGYAKRDLRPAWAGLALGVSASAALAVAQYFFDFGGVTQAAPPAGLFINKNFLAEAGMVALVSSLALGMLWAVPGAIVAAALGSSTAVVGSLLLVLAVALWSNGRRALAYLVSSCVVGAAAAFFAFGTRNAAARLDMWADALADPRWFGHGVGSFAATLPWVGYAHSEPIQMVHELGILSIPFFAVALYALGAKHEAPVEWHVLAALCAVSLLSFPFHLPLTAFAAALAAGRCVGARRPLRFFDGLRGAFARASV